MNRTPLQDAADDFALDLMERLAKILPSGDLGITSTAIAESGSDGRVAVASAHPGGIVLTIEGRSRLQLAIDFRLVLSPTSGHLTVQQSQFLVRPFDEARPLFTSDYVRDAGSNIPAAHYNFHLDHAGVVAELLETGNARRGKIHRRNIAGGKSPKLGDLHFPVGGHRFRPCLEDVLDMLRIEFAIDTRETAAAAIVEGRRRWRSLQTRAAVADHPDAAIAELKAAGYEVRFVGEGGPWVPRSDRLDAI